MKIMMSRLTLCMIVLLCGTSRFYSQLASSPTLASSNVPEASQYGVLYQLDLPVNANYGNLAAVLYGVNNSTLTLNYNRVAYFLQLDNKWVWVSMNKFNTTNAELGIPYANSNIAFQQVVSGMNVYSSAGAGVTNTTGINGNIEIWSDCYDAGPGLGTLGGANTYDFDDTRSVGSNCYGSFQVHNYGAAETIFAYNNFMSNNTDLGIGNNTMNGNPDWTFMSNSSTYTTRKLWILVEEGISFINQPSALANTACLNGTVSALTVSASINSATITNYQWYSATTATNSGGTLVATHATSLTSDSYTPSTTGAGTLYYYCTVNGTNSLTATSNVSGALTVGDPTLTISGTASICAGSSLTLSVNPASASTFTWSNGMNTSGISISPTTNTTYSVSGSSTLGCVGLSSLVTVTVNAIPVISVANGTICEGGSFVLSPTGASSYTYPGGGSTVSPLATTNYTVSGTSTAGCIGSNTVVSVVVHTVPVVSITGTNALCNGTQVNLTANGAATYTWNTNSNLSVISVSPNTTTSYTLSGTSSEGCVSSAAATTTLTVFNLPVVSITGTTDICAGASVALTANGASTYTWNTGSGASVLTVTPALTTTYSLSGTSTDGCISAVQAAITISVHTLPVISITGVNDICAGNSTSLSVSGAATYTWNTGSNAASITVSPGSNTTYSVSGTNTDGCLSSASAITTVSVNAIPVVSISGTNTVCAGSSAVLTANGASTYTWNTGSAASALTVTPSANTTYSVSGTSINGCASAAQAVTTVSVNALPVVSVAGTSVMCAGATSTLTVSGASTYTWNTGSNAASIPVSPGSNTTYSASGTNGAGCVSAASAVITVTVHALPVVSVTGTTAICAGGTATLSANGASTYTWSTGSNTSSLTVNPVATTSYTLSGISVDGCQNASPFIATLGVNALPLVTITGTNAVCAGSSIALTANGASTYTWNTNATTSLITVSPSANTVYSVSGTSANGCLGAAAITTVTVNSLPVVSISGTASICAGNSATLTAGGAATYTWNTGSTSANLSLSPVATTVYSVSGTNASGCINVAPVAFTLNVNALPTVSVTTSGTLCAGSTTSLVPSGAASYSWSGIGTFTNVAISPTLTTSYTVTGTSAAGCVGIPVIQTVTVYTIPSLTITGNTDVCPGNIATLTASGANTYTWVNAGPFAGILINPTISATYTVIGKNTAGCTNTAIRTITINPVPTLTLTGPSGICTGQSLTLTVSGASSYSWSTGSTNTLIVSTPTQSTTYSVTGTNALGCVKTSTQLVTVASSLSVSITGPTVSCSGETISLGGLGGATYTWNSGATTGTINPNPTVTTTYSITGASGTCSNTAVKTVVVNPNPTVSISGSNVICEGNSATLTAAGADTYSWTGVSTATTIIVSPILTTTYSLNGYNSFGCASNAVTIVTVNALPVIAIAGPSVICSGNMATLSASGANTYTWNGGVTTSTVAITAVNNATFSALGSDASGCVNSSSIFSLSVNPVPVLNIIGSSLTVCEGDSITYTASGANTYLWSNGFTTFSVSVKPTVTTSYTVSGTNTFFCSSSTVITASVNSLPVVVVSGPTVICLGESSSLSAGGASTYTWSTGSNGSTLNVTPTITTNYSIVGTSAEGCVGASLSRQVNVGDCTGLKTQSAANTAKLYPNPTTGSFTIELEDATNTMIVIRNVLGQVVLNLKAEQVNSIQLSEFNKGMYYVTLTKNNAVVYSTSVIKN